MQMRRWWAFAVLAGALTAATLSTPGNAPADDKPLDRKDLDAAIHRMLRTVINQGADLYNNGDWAGCYRLYEGTLLGIQPLLDHRPELQKAIDTAVVEAARSPQIGDRAFVLRKAIDRVRKDTGPEVI